MKRVLALMLLVLLGAGGIWLAQPEQRPLMAQLNRQATDLSRQAGRQVQVQLRDTVSAAEPSGPQLTKYEKLLCDLANGERRKRGLPAMTIAPALAEVARGHSREMMQKDYFSHTSPTAARRNPLDRYKLKYKRSPRLVAENIYMLKGPSFYKLTERDFRRAHEGWMKSPGHRANILRAEPMSPTRIGVGIVVKNGSFWATQNFATP
jgi:uncharacterized protein YkwD